MRSKLFLSLLDLSRCFEILRSFIYPNGVKCLECGSSHYHLDYEEKPKLQYKCCNCGKWWSDLTGTIFEGTQLPLTYWFLTLQWFSEGKSANWVALELGVHRHTIRRIFNKIRKDIFAKRLGDKLSGVVEADEVYVKGGEKGETPEDREARVRGLKIKGRGTFEGDKPPIIGVVERESGAIRLEVSEDATKETCQAVIEKHVEQGSTVNTDEWGGYNDLSKTGYDHKTVCHSDNEYARDDDGDGINEVHSNTIEGIWSLLRQYLRNFRGVCKKYLHFYVYSFEFFHNLRRKVSDSFEELLHVILPSYQ